jgi:hypothetical protein
MIDSNILVQTEDDNLVRDVNSKALLNNNLNALREYRNKKNLIQAIKNEESETKQRLGKLESDMQEIKNLLIEIAALRKQ